MQAGNRSPANWTPERSKNDAGGASPRASRRANFCVESPQPAREVALPLPSRRRITSSISIAIAVAIAVVAGVQIVSLREQRRQLLDSGDRRASNLAAILASYVRQTFVSADAALRQLAITAPRIGGSGGPNDAWAPVLSAAYAAMPAVGSISITDRAGIIRHSNQPLIIGQSRSGDYVFRRLAAGPTDSLVASPPFRIVTRNRPYLIPVGRRLETKNGEFDGVIVATIVPDELRSVFRSVNVGQAGQVALLHRNGTVVIREPSEANPIGEAAGRPDLFAALRRRNEGVLEERPQRGKLFRTAYRSVADRDLIVVVSLDVEELLADWRRSVAASIMVGILLLVAGVAIIALLDRAIETRAAAQETLDRSQRMESIGRLTGGIAHDFNNILSVILGNVELMRDELRRHPSQETEESVGQIERSVMRGSALVRQLLAFARRQPLQPRATDLAHLVRDSRTMLDRLLGEDVVLDVSIDADHQFAAVDPVGVESALLNLCVNARDAMPEGGAIVVRVTNAIVGPETEAPPDAISGRYVVVSVRDTGSGIAAAHLERVFDPFFTTKDVGRGTGLGLSVVYGFMKQSGGFATIDSAPGSGTTVSLYFPETPAPVEPEPAYPAGGVLEPAPNGETVLVVEDEPELRALTSRLLERLGYRVLSAADPHDALYIASREPKIDLLLTDIVMPGMGGRRLAAELRAQRPNLPVIFVSGYSSEDPERAEGTDQVIAKPYDRAVLAAAVRRKLTSKH